MPGAPTDFGRVDGLSFSARPVAIVAGGTSLSGFDLDRLRAIGCHVIAVKGSIFDMPWADCGIGIDWDRLYEWHDRLCAVTIPLFWGVDEGRWLRCGGGAPANVTLLRIVRGFDVSTDPSAVHCGGTSGFAAINLAVLCGARKIALFGYDYHAGRAGFRHNDRHYGTPREQRREYWSNWARSYGIAAAVLGRMGIEVVNASPGSHVAGIPIIDHDMAVERLKGWMP